MRKPNTPAANRARLASTPAGKRLLHSKPHLRAVVEGETAQCPRGDPYCPCQDGDPCNYEDAPDGTKALTVEEMPHKELIQAFPV